MENDFIIKIGRNTGLIMLDILLLTLCPIATMLGTIVSNAVAKVNDKPEFIPDSELPAHKLETHLSDNNDPELSKKALLEKHNEEKNHYFSEYQYRENKRNSMLRLPFIGFILGLVISLYFVGAINQDITSLARILGLCVLLGYQAPSLWVTQEKTIKKLVDKKVDSVLGK